MIVQKTLKVRLYPTVEQQSFLEAQFGAIRFVFNKSLAIKNHYYKFYNQNLNPIKELKPLISQAKTSRKYSWLKKYDSIALQESVRHLNVAFSKFFDPKLPNKFPRFKKRHSKQSSYHCTSIKVLENGIKIPKLKSPIEAIIHRKIDGKVKSFTLSKTPSGKYFASILYEVEKQKIDLPQVVKIEKILGIDLGLTHFLIDSNGKKIVNPRFLNNAMRNLKIKQKQLSRKKKGSKNRIKARLKVAKCHENIANRRIDFFYKLAKQLIDENQAIIVETLSIKNMIKNRKLSKHISDVAWATFIEILERKCEEAGIIFIKIDKWYASSKTCSCCGHKLEELSLNQRHWTCPNCHTYHDRDINASMNIKHEGIINIKAAGRVVIVCGGSVKLDDNSVAAKEAENLIE